MSENNIEYASLKKMIDELKEDKVLKRISSLSIKDVTTETKDRPYTVGIAYKNMLNYPRAIEWFKISAERNNSGAQHEMGEFYRHGRGLPSDYLLSMEWHLKAAYQRHPYSMAYIAEFFNFGRGISTDKKRALEWYLWCERIGHFENKHQVKTLQSNGYSLNKQERDKPLEELVKEAEEILKIEIIKSTRREPYQEKEFHLVGEIIELKASRAKNTHKLKPSSPITERLDIQIQGPIQSMDEDIFALLRLSMQRQKESQEVNRQMKLLEEDLKEMEEILKELSMLSSCHQ